METTTEIEPSEVLTPDTRNATFFNPEESNDSEKFSRLRLYNRESWKDRREENKEVTYQQDNLAVLDAISGQLGLTDYQQTEARRFFDDLHIREMGEHVNLIAFGICAIVANEDVDQGSRYHPQMSDPDDLFVELKDDLGFTSTEVHRILSTIRNRRSKGGESNV